MLMTVCWKVKLTHYLYHNYNFYEYHSNKKFNDYLNISEENLATVWMTAQI